jgi:hypothetical protein
VVPRIGRPFSKPNFYNGHDIFSDEFRKAFLENYTKREERRYFAVWAANHVP